MEIYITKKHKWFELYGEADEEAIKTIPDGTVFKVKLHRTRNPDQHRRYFAMLNFVIQNNDKYTNTTDLLTEIKVKVGHYQEYITKHGEIVYVPKSIDFDSMGEDEFNRFFSLSVDVIIGNFLGVGSDEQLNSRAFRILEYMAAA
jgi:hypothetical protein